MSLTDLPTEDELVELATQLAERMPDVKTLRLIVENLQASLRLADQLDELAAANLEAAQAVASYLQKRQAERPEWRAASARLMTTCSQLAEALAAAEWLKTEAKEKKR